jgi:hypothetical protein
MQASFYVDIPYKKLYDSGGSQDQENSVLVE